MKKLAFVILASQMALGISASKSTLVNTSILPDSVSTRVTNPSIWDGWFVQVGGDWTIQKPYSYPINGMIQNGSTLGVDIAVGKGFTHELGLRAKASWGNGIIDTKPEWLAPFNEPGLNHEKGGFLTVVGDIMLNLHNTIGGYNPDRTWNANLFLRAGGAYNFGCDKGAPLIGLGLSNQFKITNSWGIYADLAYNGVSSGFTMDPTTATGTGTGQNMFFTLDVGVTYNIGSEKHSLKDDIVHNTLEDKSFWRNWFLQFGADMTLYNPCEMNFNDVFPKGASMGLDIALGKWFSPQIGARTKLNMENFLIKNNKFEWVGYDATQYTSNYDGGGNAMAYFDIMVSVKHLLMDYKNDENWNLYGFGRMGLSRNRAIDSMSPVVGIGFGGTYHLNKRWSVYADTAYEGTTSEFFGGTSWSGPTGGRFNGIWDFNIGLQLNIGDMEW